MNIDGLPLFGLNSKESQNIMKTTLPLLIALWNVWLSANAQVRFVTLMVDGSNPGQETAETTISTFETAEIVSYYQTVITSLEVRKEGTYFDFVPSTLNPTTNWPVIITGPASFRLRALSPNRKGFCTLKVTPEGFSPDKTIIIPEGTGARIALECSTNLLQWVEIHSSTHTNVPSNKFFRIKAERLP